jgi:hypothetical protein
MFDSITTTAIIAEATTFVTAIAPVALIVIGLGLTFTLVNWVVAKFRSR